MQYTVTTCVRKIAAMNARVRVIQGGSSAGKTIAILLILIDRAQSEPGKLFSVVSETLPHLKKGAIRDFLNIMEGHGYYRESQWNRTDFIYTFENGTRIEFFSADSAEKVRGPRRDVLFINEANNIGYETYTQLAIRTNEDIYIDFNPVARFWVHDEVVDADTENKQHDFIIVTYKDNEGLPEAIVRELESRKDKKDWWTVFGLGQIGEAEGKVYTDWKQIDSVPEGARLERRWLDFGYTNDPTAVGDVYYWNGGYVLDEQMYVKDTSNKQIADTMKNMKSTLTIADAAEPKSIDEIRSYGLNIQPATKGQGSVNYGIQIVRDQNIWVTKRSTNLWKEYRNYMFEKDDDGNYTSTPIGIWNHHMDGVRYALTSLVPMINTRDIAARMPKWGNSKKKPNNPAR
jgi:phage terminase large subunit